MTLAPVVLFVYNRLDHTRQTVEALAANTLASESDLWVFSDGPKSDEDEVACVRDYIASLAEQSIFRTVTIVESPINKGLADSITEGVTTVMASADRAIVLEDDLVTATDFLKFMNDCLQFYANDPVGSISGYSPIKTLPHDYVESVYVSRRSCSWGWATWKDRWNDVDWEIVKFEALRKTKVFRKEFNSTGADRVDRLRRKWEGSIDSWSIAFGFHLFVNRLLTVYPTVTRISNIGCDGSGVHSTLADKGRFYSSVNSHPVPYRLTLPKIDDRISKAFYDLYSGSRLRVILRGLRNSRYASDTRSAARILRRS